MRVLERCDEECIINSEICRGDTWDVNRRHSTKVLVDRPRYLSKTEYGGATYSYSMTLQKRIAR